MARARPSGGPLLIVLAALFVIGSFAQHHRKQGLIGLAVTFGVTLVWCALRIPTQCRVITASTQRPCRRGTHGVLFGCTDHYWQKLALRLHLGRRPRPDAHSAASVGLPRRGTRVPPAPGVALAPSRRDTVTFYCTIVSTLGTVVSTVAVFKL